MQKRVLIYFVENNTLIVYGKKIIDYQNDNWDKVRGKTPATKSVYFYDTNYYSLKKVWAFEFFSQRYLFELCF